MHRIYRDHTNSSIRPAMDYVFDITDDSGRIIHITKERWSHIKSEHPEMAVYLADIQKTISEPDFIRKSEYDENVRFYYSYHKTRDSEKYLLTAIKYLNGSGFVITAFFTNKITGDV